MNTCPQCGGTFYEDAAFEEHRRGCPSPEDKQRCFSLRMLNETAVRGHGMRCSQVCRNGKFTRMSPDFVEEVVADVESTFVRGIEVQARTTLHEPVDVGDLWFLTGNLEQRILERVNRAVGRIIQNKVQRQTTGCTLTRTR